MQDLPLDLLAWGALLLGVFLVLHLYARWLIARPNGVAEIQKPEAETQLNLLQELQQLRRSLPHLSDAQKLEALALSALLRHACGQRWSATEQELLATCSEASREALAPLLAFTIHILFANGQATLKEWEDVLDQTEFWMENFADADASADAGTGASTVL
ncbi:MAG: hypothetical protein QM477_11005 [Planctomycetota bacterium]